MLLKKRLFLSLLALVSLVVAACGGGDSEPPPTPAPPGVVALGEEVFQVTAGGVGCQSCHGRDAKGNIGPNIIGRDVGGVRRALSGVAQMAFIELTEEEIVGVAAYLQTLR